MVRVFFPVLLYFPSQNVIDLFVVEEGLLWCFPLVLCACWLVCVLVVALITRCNGPMVATLVSFSRSRGRCCACTWRECTRSGAMSLMSGGAAVSRFSTLILMPGCSSCSMCR